MRYEANWDSATCARTSSLCVCQLFARLNHQRMPTVVFRHILLTLRKLQTNSNFRQRPANLRPGRCASPHVFYFRREVFVSVSGKCWGLSLFFLADASHKEAKHCEQCRKHTRSHKSCSWRKGKRSVPTCVSVHQAQVPARHRPRSASGL